MPEFQVTPIVLAGIAGVVLSLAFSYIPGLSTKFAAIAPEYKRLIMLLLLIISTAAIYLLKCGGIVQAGITCDQQGLVGLVWSFVVSVMANQSTYSLTPPTAAVKAAKPQ
jgi:hypothetical protein